MEQKKLTKQEWYEKIERQIASGVKRETFCEHEKLSIYAFSYYKTKFLKERTSNPKGSETSEFVEIGDIASAEKKDSKLLNFSLQLRIENGFYLDIRLG